MTMEEFSAINLGLKKPFILQKYIGVSLFGNALKQIIILLIKMIIIIS